MNHITTTNMREIKFRAWNKDWSMMSYDVDKIIFEEGVATEVRITIKASDYDHKDEWCDLQVGEDIVLMQFTGLHDKNGKEIYEGDIVKNGSCVGEVAWSKKEIAVGNCHEEDWDSSYMYSYGDEILTEYVEVIGNIYENPELLANEN